MPKGPQGQKRPADVIGAAILIGKIATGEVQENVPNTQKKSMTAAEIGEKGGKARAAKLSTQERKQIAERAAKVRWTKTK